MIKKIIILSLFVFLNLIPAAQAAGIQVSPAKLELKANAGKIYTLEITVANPLIEPQVFEIYSDGYKNIVKPQTQNLLLEAGQRKTIGITLDLTSWPEKDRNLETQVSVAATPPSSQGLNTGAGVKVPLKVTVSPVAKGFSFKISPLWSLSFLPLAAFIGFAIGKRKSSKMTNPLTKSRV